MQHGLSVNEANNLIYLGLKYSCGWKDVPNEIVAEAMMTLGTLSTQEAMVTVLTVAFRYSKVSWQGLDGRLGHLLYVVRCFFELPSELRDDLGMDTAFFSSESLH